MTEPKPAEVRVYFDADVLGLARLLAQKRADFTYPGDSGARIGRMLRPACPIVSTDIKDEDWIPVVAQHGWLIVTRDARIQDNLAELNAVRTYGAKMVNLASRDAGTVWAQLEVFMSRWRTIDQLTYEPGPFIYRLSRTAQSQIDLNLART